MLDRAPRFWYLRLRTSSRFPAFSFAGIWIIIQTASDFASEPNHPLTIVIVAPCDSTRAHYESSHISLGELDHSRLRWCIHRLQSEVVLERLHSRSSLQTSLDYNQIV